MIHQLAAPLFNANGSMLQDVARVAKSAPWVDNTILCIYALVWASLLWPGLIPLARPTASMFGAVCIVGIRRLGAALKDGPTYDGFVAVDYDTLALLIGLMLISRFMEESGVFLTLARVLRSERKWLMVIKICVASGGLSAILMNDTICLMMTPIVLTMIADERDKFPYLLAISSSANIGSALTTTGNPQNAIIDQIDPQLNFANFARTMLLPVLLCMCINTAAILVVYRKILFEGQNLGYLYQSSRDGPDEQRPAGEQGPQGGQRPGSGWEDEEDSQSSLMDSPGGPRARTQANTQGRVAYDSTGLPRRLGDTGFVGDRHLPYSPKSIEEPRMCSGRGLKAAWISTLATYVLVTISLVGMFSFFIVGVDKGGVALFTGVTLVVVHTIRTTYGAKKIGGVWDRVDSTSEHLLMRVDWMLILLFIGLFVMVTALVDTGKPHSLWEHTLGHCSPLLSEHCVYLFAFVLLILSNTISNVPLVLLIKPEIVILPDHAAHWRMVAWCSTVAGNFILLGSAANLIVANLAMKQGVPFDTKRHAMFSIPVTMVTLLVGVVMLANDLTL